MQKAVELLSAKLSSESSPQSTTRGTVILATVKGDIHDIGKNIVSVVLSCNGFKVISFNFTFNLIFKIIDLGLQCTAESIIECAEKEHAVAIGVSGLISPSLEEMVVLAKLMEKKQLKVVFFIWLHNPYTKDTAVSWRSNNIFTTHGSKNSTLLFWCCY